MFFYIQHNVTQSSAIFSEASYQASPFIKNIKRKMVYTVYSIYNIIHTMYKLNS